MTIQKPLQLPSMDKMRPKDGGVGPRMTPCWVSSWMTVSVSGGNAWGPKMDCKMAVEC